MGYNYNHIPDPVYHEPCNSASFNFQVHKYIFLLKPATSSSHKEELKKMACIISSSAGLSTRSLLSTDSIPTQSSRSIKPNSISWVSSFPTVNISINNNPSSLNKVCTFFFNLSLPSVCFLRKSLKRETSLNNMLSLTFFCFSVVLGTSQRCFCSGASYSYREMVKFFSILEMQGVIIFS